MELGSRPPLASFPIFDSAVFNEFLALDDDMGADGKNYRAFTRDLVQRFCFQAKETISRMKCAMY